MHGFVECRTWELGRENGDTAWYSAVSLAMLGVTQDCGALDCLFDTLCPGTCRPVAPARGLPPDAAELTRADFGAAGTAAFGATFLSWGEIASIDWDEPTQRREVMPPDGAWEPVWSVMRAQARIHGNDGVRLVAWFES
jgi:hypothetical protein